MRVEEAAPATSACLLGPYGSLISCARVEPRAGEERADTARRLARRFHDHAFAPRIDLTQSDLRSLDGSNAVASERGVERLRLVLGGLTGEDASTP